MTKTQEVIDLEIKLGQLVGGLFLPIFLSLNHSEREHFMKTLQDALDAAARNNTAVNNAKQRSDALEAALAAAQAAGSGGTPIDTTDLVNDLDANTAIADTIAIPPAATGG